MTSLHILFMLLRSHWPKQFKCFGTFEPPPLTEEGSWKVTKLVNGRLLCCSNCDDCDELIPKRLSPLQRQFTAEGSWIGRWNVFMWCLFDLCGLRTMTTSHKGCTSRLYCSMGDDSVWKLIWWLIHRRYIKLLSLGRICNSLWSIADKDVH